MKTDTDTRQPAIGDYCVPDGWKGFGEKLLASDLWADTSFPGCQFRLPSGNPFHDYQLAVNITRTGKDHYIPASQRLGSFPTYRCRVKIEFVGDGEPSTFSGGWLYNNSEFSDSVHY